MPHRDNLPPLPDQLNREEYIGWGQSLVDRSQASAGENRWAALYVHPIVNALITITGASTGLIALVTREHPGWGGVLGIIAAATSAIAVAVNSLFKFCDPHRLYITDRLLRADLWTELSRFKQATPESDPLKEIERCQEFGRRMIELVSDQVRSWADINGGGPADRQSRK